MQQVKRLFIFIIFFIATLTSCGPNLFEEFSQTKDSTDAILEEAQLQIDESKYDDALVTLNKLSSRMRNEKEVILLYTSVYAGKCGISFFQVADALQNAGSGSFLVLATSAVNNLTSTNVAFCDLAKAELEKIDPAVALADSRISLNSFILGFVRLGLVADTLPNNMPNAAPAFTDPADMCDPATISDANVKKLVTSLTMVLQNISAFGASNIPGFNLTALLADINANCPPGQTCLSLDEDALDFSSTGTVQQQATAMTIRSLFSTDELGTVKPSCTVATVSDPGDCCVP